MESAIEVEDRSLDDGDGTDDKTKNPSPRLYTPEEIAAEDAKAAPLSLNDIADRNDAEYAQYAEGVFEFIQAAKQRTMGEIRNFAKATWGKALLTSTIENVVWWLELRELVIHQSVPRPEGLRYKQSRTPMINMYRVVPDKAFTTKAPLFACAHSKLRTYVCSCPLDCYCKNGLCSRKDVVRIPPVPLVRLDTVIQFDRVPRVYQVNNAEVPDMSAKAKVLEKARLARIKKIRVTNGKLTFIKEGKRVDVRPKNGKTEFKVEIPK